MSNELSPVQKELLSRADSIFKSIADAASKATDFAAEQLPDIAYQYIAMERVYLTVLIVGSLIFCSLSIFLLIRGIFKDVWKIGSERIFLIFPIGLFGFIGFVMFFTNLKSFIMVWFAPKIFIITNIITLIKSYS